MREGGGRRGGLGEGGRRERSSVVLVSCFYLVLVAVTH